MKPHTQFISSSPAKETAQPPTIFLISDPMLSIAPLPSDSSHSFDCSTLLGHWTPPFPYFTVKFEAKNQFSIGSYNLEQQATEISQSACQNGWFLNQDSEELNNLAKVTSNFCGASDFNVEPLPCHLHPSHQVISAVMSRFV